MVKILVKELKGTRIIANCAAEPIMIETFCEGKSKEDIKIAANMNPMKRL